LSSKDEDEDKDLKIGPRGSSRTRTFLEDNNTEKCRPMTLVSGNIRYMGILAGVPLGGDLK